jgi:DNA polymerase III subunit alpha
VPGFIHLRAHSAYSLLEGAMPVARLVDLAVADAQPALAITDRNNLFGALEFSEKAVEKGLQPIIGCTLALDLDRGDVTIRAGRREAPASIVLLATN